MKVGIVGLGLIGGSMAKSIKARTSHTVFGIARSEETLMMARMCGAIDAPLTQENLSQCDLILIAAGHDVFGAHQPLFIGGGHTTLDHHGLVLMAHGL